MIYPYECLICGEVFEKVQGMNDKHTAFHCEVEARRIFTVPHTNRDLMYNFTDTNTFKQGVDIHSKRQYTKLLKKDGLVQLTKEEKNTIKAPKFSDFNHQRRQCAERMASRMQKEGVAHKFGEVAEKYILKKEK